MQIFSIEPFRCASSTTCANLLCQCGTPAQPETPEKCPRQQAIHWWLTDYGVLTMWDFRKQRQTAEQQRRVERVLDAQVQFLALYEQPERPASLSDELDAVRASSEQGLRDDRG